MKKSGARVLKDNASDILKALAALDSMRVMIGVPSEAGEHAGGITNAEIGYIAEFGAPEANIPARPWLEPTGEELKAEAIEILKTAAQQALDGKPEMIERAFHRLGLKGQNAARARVNRGEFTPLKASTIRRRKRRGHSSIKPLVEFGQFRNSITYVIRKK